MYRAIAIATLAAFGAGACSPYAKRDKDEHQADAGALTTRTASVARTATTAVARPAPPAKPAPSPIRYLDVRIERSVEDALVDALGKEYGTPLSQIAIRQLVWWLDVRKEFRKGDRLELAYEIKGGEVDPVALYAVWFTSQKLGKTSASVLYQAKDQPFARWYGEAGEEVELRLKNGPIDTYEQVTSLLHDGRRHKGVDFKAPVGTPVKAPFDGVIVKKNWGRNNGNCLELADAKTGHHAKLLHLEQIPREYTVGRRVKQGEVVATSGNTGHSTAPHLHYQLEAGAAGARLLDPFKVHDTYRVRLPAEEAEKAKAALAKLAALRTAAP